MKPERIAVATGALCAVLLFYNAIIFFDDTYFQRDIMLQFKPWQTLINRYLQAGRPGADWHDVVPLWNPYNHCGAPLLANLQSQVFYPPTILFRTIPSFTIAFKLFIVLHALLAFWFMYVFLRGHRADRLAAATGGILWAFNGMLASRIEFLSVYATLVWLPLLFYLLERCAREPSLRRIVPLAVALALQFLAGHAQMWFYAVLFTGGYAAFRSIQLRSWRPITGLCVAGVLALCLSAVQLLPTAEFLLHSTRAGAAPSPGAFGMGLMDSALHSLHWRDLVNILHPFEWRFEPVTVASGRTLELSNYWTKTFYIGFIGTALAIIGFVTLPSRYHRLWVVVGLIATILYTLGDTTPFYTILYRIALPLRVFRHPSTAIYVLVFTACTLAGRGADRVLRWLNGIAGPTAPLRPILLAVPLAVWSELYHNNTLITMLLPSSILDQRSPIAERLAATPDARLYRFMLTPLTQRDAPSVRGRTLYDAMSAYRRRLFGNLNIHDELFNFRGQDIELRHYHAFLDLVYGLPVDEAAPLLGIANVRYLLSLHPLSSNLLREFATEDLHIYENPLAMPRVYLAASWVTERDTGRCAAVLRRLGTRVAATAVLNETAPGVPPACSSDRLPDARVVHFTQDLSRLSFYAASAQTVVAVVSQSHYPGWRAFVNGKPHRLLRVNGFMTGLLLAPGTHQVTLVYDPLSFKLGCLISLLTILVLLLALYETWPEVASSGAVPHNPTSPVHTVVARERTTRTVEPFPSSGGTP